MSDVSLRQIRAVVAVCEEGSFTRAAARENATQSGISQHIAALERSLTGRRQPDQALEEVIVRLTAR